MASTHPKFLIDCIDCNRNRQWSDVSASRVFKIVSLYRVDHGIYRQCQARELLLALPKIDYGPLCSNSYATIELWGVGAGVGGGASAVANCLMACDAHRLGSMIHNLAAAERRGGRICLSHGLFTGRCFIQAYGVRAYQQLDGKQDECIGESGGLHRCRQRSRQVVSSLISCRSRYRIRACLQERA